MYPDFKNTFFKVYYHSSHLRDVRQEWIIVVDVLLDFEISDGGQHILVDVLTACT